MRTKWSDLKNETMSPVAQRKARELAERDLAEIEMRELRETLKVTQEELADKQIERTRTMGAYKASTLIDFERGQPLELESLFLEPLRQAHTAGVPVPRLEALCRVLKTLDGGRDNADSVTHLTG